MAVGEDLSFSCVLMSAHWGTVAPNKGEERLSLRNSYVAIYKASGVK